MMYLLISLYKNDIVHILVLVKPTQLCNLHLIDEVFRGLSIPYYVIDITALNKCSLCDAFHRQAV